MNIPLCHKCASAFWAKDVLRDGNSSTFRGCRDDSRITTYSQAELYCPLLSKPIEVKAKACVEDRVNGKMGEMVSHLKTLKVKRGSAKRNVCTPAQWCEIFGVEVIDPDGWRGDMKPDWNTPITCDMFKTRYQMSTCRVVNRRKYAQWQHFLG